MSLAQASIQLAFPQSPFPPLAVGFMGLGTGYLVYGTQELFGYPPRDERVDVATGIWGIWMPGFMQFLTGVYLFAGLTLFGTFTGSPPLYMAALAFTAFGVHWFALGWIRMRRADARANIGMTVAFLAISVLGIIVFFKADDAPVGGVFIGLACVYVAEFFATLAPDVPAFRPAEKVLGFFRLGTGLWLLYLVFAVALNFILKYTLPL
jgi:hypothetical protein